MTINREWKKVEVITYDNSLDEYGQKRQGNHSSRMVEMVCKIYSQNNTADIRYTQVDLVGLTEDKEIDDSNQIVVDGEKYEVLYVIPTHKLYQILMRKA